ncbi:MAG TPA: class I SAM-dependent methyltransferase [Caulobacteraceae bacterium]
MKGWLARLGGSTARDAAAQGRQIKDQAKQIAWLERLVTELLVEQRGSCILPPAELRLHVGAKDSAANFWNQGRNSSARVIEVFGETPEGQVLDWGCGSGRTLYWLYGREAWRKAYRGCDVDPAAIGWLKKKHGVTAVSVCSPEPPLPYAEGQFAGLFSFSVLTHIPPEHHRAWYEELHRVLAPGGRAYVTVNGDSRTADPQAFTPAEQDAFRRQGWLWAERDGHHKGAAVVSRDFTFRALHGLFEVERYGDPGYQQQADLILRRV